MSEHTPSVINQDSFERSVRDFIAQGSGLPTKNVIPGNDPGPRPADEYATLLTIDGNDYGYPQILEGEGGDDEDGEVFSVNYYWETFSLQFYRKGARDRARRFVSWARSPLGLLAAEEAQWRVRFPIGNARRLDEIVGADFEERISIDLTIDYSYIERQEEGTIESVDLELCVEPSGAIPIAVQAVRRDGTTSTLTLSATQATGQHQPLGFTGDGATSTLMLSASRATGSTA